MRVCVAISETKVLFFDVDELGIIEDIKVLIECESGIPTSAQQLTFQGRPLNDSTPILDSGILEGDILQVHTTNSSLRQQALSLLQQSNTNPNYLVFLESQNPELAQIVRTGNLDAIEQGLMNFMREHERQKQEKMKREFALDNDPLNPLNQREIENNIRQKVIDENLNYAQEFTPEVFGIIEMLYIECKVNNKAVQAFVDSGAQNTIMSKKCAEKLEIMRLVDTRFKGHAQGIGTDVIVGRIHAINLEIGGKFFNCCFHVLENARIDMLFGLDMLKRHQCCIDLNKNVLTLNAGEISIEFIHESKIKKEFEDIEDIENIEEKKAEPISKVVETSPKAVENKLPLPEIVIQPPLPKPIVQASQPQRNPKIEKLTKLGFSIAESEDALRLFNNNEEQAAAYLFNKNNLFDDF